MEKCKLLLVEDNQGDIRLVQEAVRESELDFNIRVASNGREALELLGFGSESNPENLPDIILLDLNLPRLSGREVLSMIKKDPLYRRIPVLIFSSSENQEDIFRSYQLHANCYISKPTGFEDYIKVIHSILEFWFHDATLPGYSAPEQ